MEEGRNFEEADSIKIWNVTHFILDELRPFQNYQIYILAGTSIGDGPVSSKGKFSSNYLYDVLMKMFSFLCF